MPLDTLACVAEFHRTFEQPVSDKPYIDDVTLNKFRLKLLREELDELESWLDEGNEVEVLDALTDLQYILDGTYLSLGFHRAKEPAFAEIHRSNLTKLGTDGRPVKRSDGKVLKGPNYSPPDLTKVLRELGFVE